MTEKQRITKLLNERRNRINEISTLKSDIRFLKAQNDLLYKALVKIGVKPKLCCSCYKDDCACFNDSINDFIKSRLPHSK